MTHNESPPELARFRVRMTAEKGESIQDFARRVSMEVQAEFQAVTNRVATVLEVNPDGLVDYLDKIGLEHHMEGHGVREEDAPFPNHIGFTFVVRRRGS
jgi:hypothetical protein